jgi:DNA-binding PadR family transcriptional regulator
MLAITIGIRSPHFKEHYMSTTQPEQSDWSEPQSPDPSAGDGDSRDRPTPRRRGRSHEHHGRGERRDTDTGDHRSRKAEGRGRRSDERHGHDRGEGRSRSRGRAQRGDVRAAVLLLLAEQPMHGYQLMHAISDRTEGAWRPSPGAIYPTIAQLEDEDLVSVIAEAGRKLVTLTDAGREYLAANQSTIGDPFTAITDQAGGRHDLRGSVEQVYAAARAVGKAGNDAQIAAAQEVLNQTRRALYLILADTPAT